MVQSPVWRDALVRYRWSDRYLAGDAFARFTDSEEARVRDILRKLGTGGATTATLSSAGPYPMLVLAGLALTALAAAVAAFRAHAPAADSVRAGWKAIALIAAGIVIDVVLLERAGFVIASAALFWLTARAFDPEHPARDAAFALGVSIGAYLLFARALQLTLPAGVLAGWI
jgi:putative tricarboxylic transport membrane protein